MLSLLAGVSRVVHVELNLHAINMPLPPLLLYLSVAEKCANRPHLINEGSQISSSATLHATTVHVAIDFSNILLTNTTVRHPCFL